MFRSAVCGAPPALIASRGAECSNRGAAPVGTDAAPARSNGTARGAMNQDHRTGAEPDSPEPGMSGRR